MPNQIKSKERVKEFAEVYTNEREVKAMLDLLPPTTWDKVTAKFLEPACGNGNFLVEILERKLQKCKDPRSGLKALNSIFGIDILPDNVTTAKERMLEIYKAHYPGANAFILALAQSILDNRIICDDALDPKTGIVKSWGIMADESYVKFKKKQELKRNAENNNP